MVCKNCELLYSVEYLVSTLVNRMSSRLTWWSWSEESVDEEEEEEEEEEDENNVWLF